jgi:hypothetical protein
VVDLGNLFGDGKPYALLKLKKFQKIIINYLFWVDPKFSGQGKMKPLQSWRSLVWSDSPYISMPRWVQLVFLVLPPPPPSSLFPSPSSLLLPLLSPHSSLFSLLT